MTEPDWQGCFVAPLFPLLPPRPASKPCPVAPPPAQAPSSSQPPRAPLFPPTSPSVSSFSRLLRPGNKTACTAGLANLEGPVLQLDCLAYRPPQSRREVVLSRSQLLRSWHTALQHDRIKRESASTRFQYYQPTKPHSVWQRSVLGKDSCITNHPPAPRYGTRRSPGAISAIQQAPRRREQGTEQGAAAAGAAHCCSASSKHSNGLPARPWPCVPLSYCLLHSTADRPTALGCFILFFGASRN